MDDGFSVSSAVKFGRTARERSRGFRNGEVGLAELPRRTEWCDYSMEYSLYDDANCQRVRCRVFSRVRVLPLNERSKQQKKISSWSIRIVMHRG
jgi:hypothetical protein